MTTTKHRPISEIAVEIKKDWAKPYFGAVPYIDAMLSIDQITDRYYQDTAEEIVARFIGNASSWRGETARRIKAELREILGTVK